MVVAAGPGTVLAAGYLLWMYQRTAFGNPKTEFEHEHIHDVHVPEYLAWAPMLALIVGLGVVPNLIFRQTNGPVTDNVTERSSNQPVAPGQRSSTTPASTSS